MIERNGESGFYPDRIYHPGESILDIMQEKGWRQADLASRMGYSEKHISELVNGKAAITPDAAQKLASVLGSSMGFWLALEANYQKHKARLDAGRRCAEWSAWIDDLPLKHLMECEAIPKQRITQKTRPMLVDAMLRFFGVASPEEWLSHYGGMQVSFRRTREEQSDIGAISAWLRLGEQCCERLTVATYSKKKFEASLQEIRGMTCDAPNVFSMRMKELLRDAGVLLVFVPAIPGAHVSGVARWLKPTRPLIQMSLYGKTNDRFWFTFFHEAAHIILHANGDKKSIFLDDGNAGKHCDPCEYEANKWAGELLIPACHEPNLRALRSKNDVVEFARVIGVHPGIVVGRLQHDGIIQASWMNDLKQKLRLSS